MRAGPPQDYSYFAAAFCFFQRAFWASLILFRASALIFRRRRLGEAGSEADA
jgi:hypothetical protein